MHKYDISLEENKQDVLNIIFSEIRPESRILEFGCGNGRLTGRLQKERKCRVTIVERDEELYKKARIFAEDGICADIMDLSWKKFPKGAFDYIVFADVLEHLIEPERILRECKPLLKENGKILISIPNLAHNDILLQLYRNCLNYTETGIMDKTHLRFFTYKSALKMFAGAGYQVVYENCISKMTGCTEQLLLEDYPVDDFLRVIENREWKNVYQFVFQLVPSERTLADETISLIEKNSDVVERRIFFDFGDGYKDENQISYYARQSDKCFDVRTNVEKGTRVVRFDPVMKLPCCVTNLQVISNRGYLHASNNGRGEGRIEFPTFSPSIYITELEGVEWLVISGEITYSYDYYEKNALLSQEEEFTRKIREKQRELHEAEQKAEEDKGTIERLQARLEELQGCLSGEEQQLAETKEALEGAQEELLRTREALRDTGKKWDQAKEALKETREQLDKEKQNQKEAEKRLQDTVQKLAGYQQLNSEKESRHKRKIEQYEAQLQAKEQTEQAYERQIQEALKAIQEIKAERESLLKEKEEALAGKEKRNRELKMAEAALYETAEREKKLLTLNQELFTLREAERKEYEKLKRVSEEQQALLKERESLLEKLNFDQEELKGSQKELLRKLEKEKDSCEKALSHLEELQNKLRESEDVSHKRDDNISHLQRVNKNYERILEEQEHKIRELEELVRVYSGSTSWKITAPLRKLTGMLKGRQIVEMPQIPLLPEKEEAAALEPPAALREEEWNWDVPLLNYEPLVTVIVPNYNHAPYLKDRLESIYHQTYQKFEVLLLDDCSRDNSREILESYARQYPEKTKCVFNTENCGKIVWQWNRGIGMARGELIWIAESDDYCELDFLEKMVPLLARESVMLAFARSVFMQDGHETWNTEQYLADIPAVSFDKPFTMAASEIVERAFSIKNIIPNVSSALFRNTGQVQPELQKIFGEMKLSGDWIFYLDLIKGGCISYTNETTNYYRIHKESTSLKVQQTMDYYEEYEMVCKYIANYYRVPEENYRKIQHILKEHYRAIHKTADAEEVDAHFSVEAILEAGKKRVKHILMACFSLQSGGGETYAVYLANELKRQGQVVTMLDFRMQDRQEEIRELLRKDIPLVSIQSLDHFYRIVSQLGGDIIHSHHASVDMAVASWLAGGTLDIRQVITLHGMYDAMEETICADTLKTVDAVCSRYVYIADKNLEPFKRLGRYQEEKFVKLPNGLPEIKTEKLKRSDYGLKNSDFVLVIASRGIPEKGWAEGIEAVELANKNSRREIHLLILGDGEVREELEKKNAKYVQFLGNRKNVRDFYKMADAGLVPTRFKGESYPLVIIECLQSGRPVIATDIAEVRNELTDEWGNLAGILLNLNDWKLDVKEIAAAIQNLANNKNYYQKLKKRCSSASRKFDMEKITRMYRDVYEGVTEKS